MPMADRMVAKFALAVDCRAFCRINSTRGAMIDDSKLMIVTTSISSINVKPLAFRLLNFIGGVPSDSNSFAGVPGQSDRYALCRSNSNLARGNRLFPVGRVLDDG